MNTILLIEDDLSLLRNLKYHLIDNGYKVITASNITQIECSLKDLTYDLVLLDINLPDTDGFYICKRIRDKSDIPIIIVSARNKELEQVLGLELGADDYLTKPYNLNILLAKIKRFISRSYVKNGENTYNIEGLKLNITEFTLQYENKEVELSKNEFKLLKYFYENRDIYIKRERFLECIWDTDSFIDDNTLTVNVSRIKKKLEVLGLDGIIKTKWGVGYLFSTKEISKIS